MSSQPARRPVRALLTAGAAALGLLIAASPAHAAPEYTGRVVVKLDGSRGAQQSLLRSLLTRTGARASGPRVPQIGLVTLRPGLSDTLSGLLGALRGDRRVESAQRERRKQLRMVPNDPALRAADPSGSGLALQWWPARQNAYAAWDIARGAGATVAVIDSGVDASHPDLQGRVDTVGAAGDPDGHGTHVASLACANANNGVGMAGMGFGCRVLALRTDLSDASIAASIVAAADRGAQAINMSFGDEGGSQSRPIADALDYAAARNVVLVAAAADSPVQEQGEPANLLQPSGSGANINAGRGLVVTAAAANDRRAGFAGLGTQISLAAYGAARASASDPGPPGIFAAYPANRTPRESGSLIPPSDPCNCRTSLSGDTRYAYLAGTSMAAPQVAAVAAMIRAHNPDLSGAEVVWMIKQSARRPSGGWNTDLGWGILDAGAALAAAHTVDRRPPSSRASAPKRVRAKRTKAGTRARVLVRSRTTDAAAPGVQAAGVRRVSLYRAKGKGPLRRIGTMTRGARRVRVKAGSTYRFATRAMDQRNNAEALPRKADVTVRVLKPRKKKR